ncbi:ATP-binding cassette domain-containing protein [Geochorda subterranea]|uniref:ATP-binding cassette domain-containing protein n=1 Tax=Geochorda subterranea TaxID=3109564 RepID=A0ABZ1BTC1_9FIRM|nr:ATP-binding cassette domain-containing protein [Limnochorda sp. LNt]WRP15989.1 ATP-binding cassette domain-containing protein [Limnochorda sp. LNt]
MRDAPRLEMRGIVKRFGAVVALDGVDFEVGAGEVMALLGDNGAGKSTLMKILAGAYLADSGEIRLEGREVVIRQPEDARRLGIEMIYQDLALCENIDVTANVFLGRELRRRALGGLVRTLDGSAMTRRTAELLDSLGVSADIARRKVRYLSGGQRQSVAICRALLGSPRLVVMDEPTAALGIAEVARVLELIRRLKAQGVSVVLISHRLQDVFEVADRATVLRNGRVVGVRRIAETTPDEITGLIVGAGAARAAR